jgi:signal transduction histidine kinase
MKTVQLKVTETNELLEAFISNTPFGVIVIDLTGKIKTANSLFRDYLEIDANFEVENATIQDLIKEIPELFDVVVASLKEGKQPFNIESLILNERYLTVSGQVILDGYIITIEDISKQKELEANSIQAILDGQENERRRIGRDIHDGIGPLLSFMKLGLDSFIDDLHNQNPSINTEALDNISETIDSLTVDLRSLSHSLVPRLLDEFGLCPAFENLIYRLNETKKASIELYTNIEKDKRLDHEIELNIFRCGQELLSNAVKHSKAKNILVQVILHKESIVLMVEDDGVGFKKDKIQPENFGIGLTNIDTRVRLLNGVFTLDSVLNKGTVVSIEIPL